MLEAIALAVITSSLYYTVTKIDGLDHRLDKLALQLEKLEAKLPKRKDDRSYPSDNDPIYYSPNSGVDL